LNVKHPSSTPPEPVRPPRRPYRRLLAALPLFLCLAALPPVAHAAEPAADPSSFPAREKGRRALADGLNEAAARFFREYREATRLHEPAYTDATTRLIHAEMQMGDVDAAVAVLAEYDASGRHTQEANYREKLELWRGALLLARGLPAEARPVFQAIADTTSHEGRRNQALEQLGDACARQGKWADAETAFRRLLQHLPAAKEPELRLRANLGVLKSMLAGGDPERGAAMLDGLEKGGAPAATLNLYRSLLLLARNRLDDAWALFRDNMKAPAAPRTGTDFWLISGKMAEALAAAGRFSEAKEVLEGSLPAAPSAADRRQTRLRMAECLAAQGKTEAAIAALESFGRDFPGTPELAQAELRLADLLRQSKNFTAAAAHYQAVCENTAAPAVLRHRAALGRAQSLRDAGKLAEAAQAFRRASQLGQTPDEQAGSLLAAAETALAAGQSADAAAWYKAVADDYPALPLAEKARFNQGLALARAGRPAEAAAVFRHFLAAHSGSTLVHQARLELGRTLKEAGDFAGAIRELTGFVADAPADPLAPQSLLEAHEAAVGADDLPMAVRFLTSLLEKYPDSPLAPDALYQRTRLHFLLGESAAALADGALFLEKHANSPLGADILMWLGDHSQNTGKSEEGEAKYLAVAARYPASPLAPAALLAAAKSAFLRGDTERAGILAAQLFRDYDKSMAPDVRAPGELLRGDLLAGQGNYEEALARFTAAAGADSAVAFAAAGRQAEMLYSLADSKPEAIEKAAALFRDLAANEKAPAAEREKARYRLAKAYEKLAQAAAGDKAREHQKNAIQEYLNIVYQYDADVRAGKVRDWYYFARAGADAARLLVLNEQYLEAARLYERLAAAGIPESKEAAENARRIRAAHGLDK
jgi:TolA-binding protein